MEIQLPNSVVETIKKRCSIRTYENKTLLMKDRERLRSCMDTLRNPFDVSVKLHIIDMEQVGNERLGTYGVIKGAKTFLGVSVDDTELAPIAAGYEFENLILYATSIGLGTVWLAATFNRNGFVSAMDIQEGEILLAISPVGYSSRKKRITEVLMRSAMKSTLRKEWNELFFQENFCTPLTKSMAGIYALALEMLRLAPSAKNQQPWRVRKSGSIYHFYVTYKSGISREEIMIKKVDVGIALSHFHQTVMEQGLVGHFEKREQDDVEFPKNTHYVISWCCE